MDGSVRGTSVAGVPGPSGAGGACALEPTAPLLPSDTPCDRCSTYAHSSTKCEPAPCATCSERAVPSLVRDPPDFAGVVRGVSTLLGTDGFEAAVVGVVRGLPLVTVGTLVGGPPLLVNQPYGFCVGTFAEAVPPHLPWRARVPAVSPHLARVVWRVMARDGSVLGVRVLVDLQSCFWMLLPVVPGIAKAMSPLLAVPLVMPEDVDSDTAMSRSAVRMSEYRWTAFFTSIVAIAPAVLDVLVYVYVVVQVVVAGTTFGTSSGDPVAAVPDPTHEAWTGLETASSRTSMPVLLLTLDLVPAVFPVERAHASVDELRR